MGVLCVAAFVFPASILIWLAIKKTMGLRVPLKEEIQGLDIGEHGNQAYPDFVTVDYTSAAEYVGSAGITPATVTGSVPMDRVCQ